MSQSEDKQDRIKARIAQSQARLTRESTALAPVPANRTPPAPTAPREDLRSLAADHPLLTVAAGVGAGLLLGALLPRRFGSGIGKRAIGLAGIGAELALTLSRTARSAASDGAREGLNRIEEGTAPLRRRADHAGKNARSTGVRLAGEAIRFATRLRK